LNILIYGWPFYAIIYKSYKILTRAQLLLRWPRNVAQFEFLLSSARTNFNAIFLRDLWDYHYKSYIAGN